MPLSHGLLSFRHFTRLISIVSKPMLIVVVVVVIDVVFVKKILGPKKFWLKNIHVQKMFGSKRVRFKKVVVQKIKVQKRKFKSKKIWDLTLKFGQN